jgi:hypothetical protein
VRVTAATAHRHATRSMLARFIFVSRWHITSQQWQRGGGRSASGPREQ